jgi:hypothetical protein
VAERDRLTQVLHRLDARQDHAVGAEVEGAFDQPWRQFGEADQRDGVAAGRRTQVLDDVVPVELSVFGIDDDPVEAERDGHPGDVRRFQRDPQPQGRPRPPGFDAVFAPPLSSWLLPQGCGSVRRFGQDGKTLGCCACPGAGARA